MSEHPAGEPATPARGVRHLLDTALAYQATYANGQRPATCEYVQAMRDDNDAEITRLRTELEENTRG